MTESDKRFMEALVKGLEAKIDSIKDLFEEKINNVKYEIDKHRADIIDIYEKIRVNSKAIADNGLTLRETKTLLADHKDNHKEGNDNKRSTIAIIISVIVGIVAIISLVLKFGGKA